jgi:hypothetical protein
MNALDLFDIKIQQKNILTIIHKESQRKFVYNPKNDDIIYYSPQTIKSQYDKILNGDCIFTLDFDNFQIVTSLTLGSKRATHYSLIFKEEILTDYPPDDIKALTHEFKYLKYIVNNLTEELNELKQKHYCF